MSAKLVTVGDSLTQGFQSGAIVKTQWSWPKLVANALGISGFRAPDFSPSPGGPMVDLERLVRGLGAFTKETVDWWEYPGAVTTVLSFLGEVEEHWERGPGTHPVATGPLHHNLAVWGFEVGDADTLTDAICRRNTPTPRNHSWLQNQVPEYAMYRTARRTLNPGQQAELEELSQLGAARALAEKEGGIENLVVVLGANNVLGTCTSLSLNWSQSSDFRKLAHQRSCTIWDPDHFGRLLERVYGGVQALKARGLVQNVYVGTVPHVTVAPVTRGVSPDAMKPGSTRKPGDADGYYEYYTHFWVWDREFAKAPEAYPRFSREDARLIDGTIDQYNQQIRDRAKKEGWHVIDVCALLDALAFRRRQGKPVYRFPDGLARALKKHPKTAFRVFPDGPSGEQRVLLDARYLNIRPDPAGKVKTSDFDAMQRRYTGGLFSLDGVHPTTIGYGIFAHEFLKVMKDAGVRGADPAQLDWDAVVANDTLVTDPPVLLNGLQELFGFLSSRAPLAQLVQRLAGFGAQPMD
ncbi:MAG: hypothetical protein L0Y64_12375 [Myxococcaceae bacterium]|nr:hypothetical protein [Myxococcaceae bacterium]